MVEFASPSDSNGSHDGLAIFDGLMEHSKGVGGNSWVSTGSQLTQLCYLDKLKRLHKN